MDRLQIQTADLIWKNRSNSEEMIEFHRSASISDIRTTLRALS